MYIKLPQTLTREIDKLSNHSLSNKDDIQKMRKRLTQGKLIRDENPEDHFCVMFVPFDKKSGKVFLGHHKKANDWIPPGGHIEKDESPVEAAIREAKEELDITISEHQLRLFTLDHLDVSAPNKICKIHWHIWYLFNTEETDYKFDRNEFSDAGWFTLEKALQKIRIPTYRDIISRLMSSNI